MEASAFMILPELITSLRLAECCQCHLETDLSPEIQKQLEIQHFPAVCSAFVSGFVSLYKKSVVVEED